MITCEVGNTPLVKLRNMYGNQCGNVYVKLEEFNPGGSIKTRVAFQMIEDAEIEGRLKEGDTLIEPTGGNTGLGLAIAASIKNYKLILTIPDSFSKEKINTLKEYGANVLLSNHKEGNNSHILLANKMIEENPNYICLDQFSNESNPKAHYFGTGREIYNQLQGKIDIFVSSIGSGGTIMGCGKLFKEIIPNIKIIGVQPDGCEILKGKFIPHKIQATAVGVISKFFNPNYIDSMTNVTFEEAMEVKDFLAKRQGIFVGISGGANIAAAFKTSKSYNNETNIVTVAPDSGRSYLEYYSK